jgi:hypothetical protein
VKPHFAASFFIGILYVTVWNRKPFSSVECKVNHGNKISYVEFLLSTYAEDELELRIKEFSKGVVFYKFSYAEMLLESKQMEEKFAFQFEFQESTYKNLVSAVQQYAFISTDELKKGQFSFQFSQLKNDEALATFKTASEYLEVELSGKPIWK